MTEDVHMHDSAASGLQMILSDQDSIEADRMDIVEDGPYIKQRNALVPLPIVNEQQPQVELSLQDTSQLNSNRYPQQDVLISASTQHSNPTTLYCQSPSIVSLDEVRSPF